MFLSAHLPYCISFSPNGSGASYDATRTVRAERLARLTRKLVGVGQAEIDLLPLRDQIARILNVEH
jgi:hypothetical protein